MSSAIGKAVVGEDYEFWGDEAAVLETYAEVFDGPETGEDDYDGDD